MARALNYADMNLSLKNDVDMPALGLGTFHLNDPDHLYQTLDYALEAGYRYYDTASAYGNEIQIRNCFERLLLKHGLTREDLFITTKLSPLCAGGEFIAKSFERTLENLGLEYIDLYLIHFPGPPRLDTKTAKDAALRPETWVALSKLYDEHKIRAIGVSNCSVKSLTYLSDIMNVNPMVNQIEWNPFVYQPEMLQYCCDHQIRLQAFSPFGGLSQGKLELLEHPIVTGIAGRYQVSPAQVLLVWTLQRGVGIITRSTDMDHMRENRSLNFRLTDQDMFALDSLSTRHRKFHWDSAGMA